MFPYRSCALCTSIPYFWFISTCIYQKWTQCVIMTRMFYMYAVDIYLTYKWWSLNQTKWFIIFFVMDNQKTHVESSLLEQMFLNSIWELKTQLLWLNLCLDRFIFFSFKTFNELETYTCTWYFYESLAI